MCLSAVLLLSGACAACEEGSAACAACALRMDRGISEGSAACAALVAIKRMRGDREGMLSAAVLDEGSNARSAALCICKRVLLRCERSDPSVCCADDL